MRTVELLDEVFEQAEQAERAATARGVTVVEYLAQKIAEDAPSEGEPKVTGRRVEFPSSAPTVRHTNITKEMIDRIELEDYLGRSGLSGA